jgi:hypothetical protein
LGGARRLSAITFWFEEQEGEGRKAGGDVMKKEQERKSLPRRRSFLSTSRPVCTAQRQIARKYYYSQHIAALIGLLGPRFGPKGVPACPHGLCVSGKLT